MSGADWAMWIAAAVLVAGAGKFIDEYHIRATTRSRMREYLIAWFLWVDRNRIPDIGGFILSWMDVFHKPRRTLIAVIAIAASAWAILTAFYIGREVSGMGNTETYVSYIITWIPMDREAGYWLGFLLCILIPSLLALAAIAYYFHRASAVAQSDWTRLVDLAAGVALSLVISLVGMVPGAYLFPSGGYPGVVMMAAAMASTVIPIAFVLVTIVLIAIRFGLRAVRWTLMQIFDGASGPTVSPFAYTCALIGVLVLVVKLGLALLDTQSV